ncbi:hypothetical protein L1987_08744 [Smallanthus sonchifolius]|uniref:Uncharacterized protein n=1 Tax=Smallanthus sonchifolius TaxID=185202 RepID=A0ACB9JN71_9ASTR|nr:hypothetical protein L1987_08744 [Smallanthus sonchifolius]
MSPIQSRNQSDRNIVLWRSICNDRDKKLAPKVGSDSGVIADEGFCSIDQDVTMNGPDCDRLVILVFVLSHRQR